MTSDHFDFEVVESPLVPKGTVYLVPTAGWPENGFLDRRSITWYSYPWPGDPYLGGVTPEIADVARIERRKALDHLAGELDSWCHEMGLDPDQAWRGPKVRERDAERWGRNWRMDERVSMAILNPHAITVIGPTS